VLELSPAIAANRFGLGARPGELAQIGSQPRDWLIAQLSGSAPLLIGPGLRSSAETLAQGLEVRRELRAAKRAAAEATSDSDDKANSDGKANAVAAVMKLGQVYRPIYIAEATARLNQGVITDRPFVERLTYFWTNHFAVSIDKNLVLGLAGSLEREAIRPNVLGHFSDMLLAVERHPAMLLYLDNHLSIGPHSRAAGLLERRRGNQRRVGINENLARETLELHTLGVGGGYSPAKAVADSLAVHPASLSSDPRSMSLARKSCSESATPMRVTIKALRSSRILRRNPRRRISLQPSLYATLSRTIRHLVRSSVSRMRSCRATGTFLLSIARSSSHRKHGVSHSRSTRRRTTTSCPRSAACNYRQTVDVLRSPHLK